MVHSKTYDDDDCKQENGKPDQLRTAVPISIRRRVFSKHHTKFISHQSWNLERDSVGKSNYCSNKETNGHCKPDTNSNSIRTPSGAPIAFFCSLSFWHI